MDVDDMDLPALIASLQPWIQLLASNGASYALKNPARTELGVVFRFSASFHKLKEGGDADDAVVVKLREAFDLVYRLLALHTATALKNIEGWSFKQHPRNSIDDPSMARALARDAPFEMEVSIAVRKLHDITIVKHKLADALLTELAHNPSTEPTYVAAKETLDAMLLKKNPQWAETVVRQPILIKCWLETARDLEMDRLEAEAFFTALVNFADVLDKFETPPSAVAGHLPVRVTIDRLHLSPVPITPAVVRTVARISAMQRVRLNGRVLTIGIGLVACRRDDFKTFLETITEGVSDGVRVNLVLQTDIIPLNPVRFVEDLLLPIVACESITTLHIGGLLDLLVGASGREAIHQLLIQAVLMRPKPMHLIMGLAGVGEVDVDLFTELVQKWRLQHPDAKLRLKKLEIDFWDHDHDFTNAMIAALDEVEELSIDNPARNAPPISIDQVTFILGKFQTLQELSLSHVHLETMHIFSTKSPRTMHTLDLCQLQLDDRPSILDFIQDLGYGERPLAQQLRHLSISKFPFSRSAAVVRLSEEDVHSLAWTLQNNRVLETVNMTLDETSLLEQIPLLELLEDAAGSVIPAAPRVRRGAEEKARRVAFLSVLNAQHAASLVSARPVLDSWLVRLVFEFSNPWVSRSVRLNA